MNSAGPLHQYAHAHDFDTVYATELGFLLSRHPDTMQTPDAGFVTRDRVIAVGKVRSYWPGAPDLVVQVISVADLYTELAEKLAD